jgi:DNA ligase (NAD+)
MAIKDFMGFAAKKYYEGQPVISDEEFDALAEQNNYIQLGAKAASGIAHVYPLYSLQKVYEGDPLPFDSEDAYISVKLDGAAVSLTYIDGKLTMALTRGDGSCGQPITENMRTLVPNSIRVNAPIVQITGEVVAPATIKNARNYAAGALNLKSVDEFKTRNLSFVAYGVQPVKNLSYTEDLYWLIEQGFLTVLDVTKDFFPSDGFVYRVYDNKKFLEMGYTAHHPRGAYALKKQKEGVVTTLRSVTWNVGRSGVVSPVGNFDEVEVDGARVSKATLHNMKYIEALGLEEGCKIKVIRSGDIIPRIIERVLDPEKNKS